MVPLQGRCTIVDVSEETILGETIAFVTLRPFGENGGLIKIPLESMDARGVRPVMEPTRMLDILETPLRAEPEEVQMRPHQRFKRWVDLLRSGEPGVRRQILRELQDVEKVSKKLTKQETELRQRLRSAFLLEVEAALGLSPSQAGRLINRSLSA
jgi:RNA polymerase-interacting CarD/CdnL/TRCF family regulator